MDQKILSALAEFLGSEELAIEKYDEMVAEQEDLDRNLAATKYQRERKEEYNKLNQFELQYDDSLDDGTRWKDAIEKIKEKYPK